LAIYRAAAPMPFYTAYLQIVNANIAEQFMAGSAFAPPGINAPQRLPLSHCSA